MGRTCPVRTCIYPRIDVEHKRLLRTRRRDAGHELLDSDGDDERVLHLVKYELLFR